MLALTDIWSAIRNACASRLGTVSAYFNIEHVENLFNSLVKVEFYVLVNLVPHFLF